MEHKNQELTEKAKNCHSCLEWLHICKAECCKQFSLTKNNVKKERMGFSTEIPTEDLVQYYYLHGAYIKQRRLYFPAHKYQIIKTNNNLLFIRPCNYLKDNKCTEHKSGNRPLICKQFNENDKKAIKGAYITPRCLARFK